MARIGFKKAKYNKIDTATSKYATLTGTPAVVPVFEKVVDEKFAPEYNTAELYANDGLAESDYSFKKGTLSLTVADDDDELCAELLGNTDAEGEVASNIDDIAPEFGYGHIIPKLVGGVRKFKVEFFPIPVPPYGHIDSGIATYSSYPTASATRVQLPCPFSWPIRTFNLKRCLLITRIPVEGGKELVIVNLHLEAYDDGEGKAAQAQMLMDILNEETAKGNYVIAGGDFNQSFSSVKVNYPVFPEQWQPAYTDCNSNTSYIWKRLFFP